MIKKEKTQLNSEEKLPIVLLHGTTGLSEDWSRALEALTSHHQVIRPNYLQPASDDVRTLSDLAAGVVAAAATEGKSRFHLVGFSLGAAVAVYIAAEYPEMVHSLVLVSGFTHGSEPRMKLQFNLWLHLVRTDRIALTKLLLVTGLSREFLSAFDEPTLDHIIKGFVAAGDWPLIEQALAIDLSTDVREQAKRIKAATLLVSATHDQIVPPVYSADLAHLIPHATKAEISSGHLSFLENPIDLASVISEFVRGASSEAGQLTQNAMASR
jgi:3-oxoadipate enol-lactonase